MGGRERPGCITAYAILGVLSGILYAIAGGIGGLAVIVDQPDMLLAGGTLMVCGIALAIIPIVMAVGLWRMRMWAWWLVVILQSLGIGLTLLSLCGSLLQPEATELAGVVVGTTVGMLINGIILYWFLTNRDRFRQHSVVHVGGKALEEPTSDNAVVIIAATVIGVIAILCLVGVAVIALLTLMGPQIGTVFSEITSGLTTPAP